FCGWKWKGTHKVQNEEFLYPQQNVADPQIEGDAKILRQGKRGEIDLLANDIYLRHVYTSFVSPYSLFTYKPTHTIVLGDLFSSQWIRDGEFNNRVERYKWIFGDPKGEYNHKFINLTGNHDIGYNWDIDQYKVNRWKREFGQMNFKDWIPSSFEKKKHRMSVINSMNVDGPALDENLRSETWSLLNNLKNEKEQDNYQTPLIFLTHIPLYKHEGICVDGPMTKYDQTGRFITEQNHLSQNSSEFILTKLRPKFIFAGHDHEGCDVTHIVRINKNEEYSINHYRTRDFEKEKYQIISKDDYYEDGKLKENVWIVREVTVRSVMGAYGGNAGLFEINRLTSEDGSEEFEYNYSSCPFVINHVPWILFITDIIVLSGWTIRFILSSLTALPNRLKNLLLFQEKQKKKMVRRNSYRYKSNNILSNIN
ncbi:459_t:CDS:2, partial [Funneliformis geosporum]